MSAITRSSEINYWLCFLLLWIVGGIAGPAYAGGRTPMDEQAFQNRRLEMVATQIANRDVSDPTVLTAMRKVPRHRFMAEKYWSEAYDDHPLPIGEGQTISQPYIVAKMTELAGVKKNSKVLEIGTGSGYQAAVLAELGAEVYSIEIIESLSKQAGKSLESAGYKRVHLRVGDGFGGWPEMAPFDAIVATAAPEEVPQPLVDQLKVGGKLVIPVGKSGGFWYGRQDLVVVERNEKGTTRKNIFPVVFVPMTRGK
ncbi:MAG: protein-L-isoaspartate(D-aspartate) O-methyltransferase [Pseudomonadota bacterium]